MARLNVVSAVLLPIRKTLTLSKEKKQHWLKKESGGTLRLRAAVIDAKDADVIGDEPIALNGEVVGWMQHQVAVHGSRASVAMGYAEREKLLKMKAGQLSY